MNLKKRSLYKPYLLLLPVLIVILCLFLGGVLLAVMQSLGYFPLIGLDEITFKYYIEVLTEPQFINSLFYSLYVSFTAAILSVIIGVFLAYQLFKLPHEHLFLNLFYKLPIIVPHIVVSLIVFLLFTQSGFISRLFYNIGVIGDMRDFPSMIFDNRGIGIILAYLWKQVPFVTLITYTLLKNINNQWEQAAKNLGASQFQIFWNIYLPLILPGIGSAFIIVFAFSFGAFEIPMLLGPSNPRTLPVLAYQRFSSVDLLQRPYAMVIMVVVSIICFILIYFYKKLLNYTVKF